MSVSPIKESARELKDFLLELAKTSDAARGGYEQNKALLEKSIAGERIEYHFNLINLGFLRALSDCPACTEQSYRRVVSLLAELDSALKNETQCK
jgi:hypothetical protein